MLLSGTEVRPKQAGGTEEALIRSGHIAWMFALSVVGIAGVYFAALYLLAH
jgi:hypothetical protein